MIRLEETLFLDEVDSTNSYALRNFECFESGTLIVARSQSAGRGRKGRSWASPPGVNVYASLILKGFKFLPAQASWIGSLAALETLRSTAPRLEFSVKWPNDILCGDAKIAGVLCEGKLDSSNPEKSGIVIGMGMNVNMDAGSLAALGRPATSLLAEIGTEFGDVDGIALSLGEEAMFLYETANRDGIDVLHKMWKAENCLAGKNVEAALDDGSVLSGKVEGFSLDGSIVVRLGDGSRRSIASGEVSLSGKP